MTRPPGLRVPEFFCSCGHSERAHFKFVEVRNDDAGCELDVTETYPCRPCDGKCQDFEVEG